MPQTAKKKNNHLTVPRGMFDVLPQEYALWERIRKTTRDIADYYNFWKMETPLIERAELIERIFPENLDLAKHLFIPTQGGERLIVRFDATASIIRSYVENNLASLGQPVKVFYEGSIFGLSHLMENDTVEEMHSAGFEIIDGDSDPVYDAQVILASYRVLESLKISNLNIALNTLCCRHCRAGYKKQVNDYIKSKKTKLCDECKNNFPENPLKILACKSEEDVEVRKASPKSVDFICTHCRNHFKAVFEYLEELGLPYTLVPDLVSKCGYATGTLFEIVSNGIGHPLASGGRHNYLIEAIGGKNTPAVGGVVNFGRIMKWLKDNPTPSLTLKIKPKIFLIHIGALARKRAFRLVEQLRQAHINVWESLGKDSLDIQLKLASKMESPISLIFGQKEAFEDTIIVRDMKNGAQETIPLAKIVDTLRKQI